jgi:uncharacterized protein YqkB
MLKKVVHCAFKGIKQLWIAGIKYGKDTNMHSNNMVLAVSYNSKAVDWDYSVLFFLPVI